MSGTSTGRGTGPELVDRGRTPGPAASGEVPDRPAVPGARAGLHDRDPLPAEALPGSLPAPPPADPLPADPPPADPPPADPAGGGAEPAGLDSRSERILAFERRWWRHAGAKEQAIRDAFGLSPTRYYQLLNRLLDEPAALAHDPVLISRLRRLRASRTRSRQP